ncbi:MAG: GGDEF domain-containing protein [Methylococcaceae bacterium]|nr:GGDEF domain-containing protein [Methylococcaceae bacterium]
MPTVTSIQIIDSLGEITRHRDREIIEKSLLKTLGELAPNQEFRLFRVFAKDVDGVALGLLAYSINGHVETSGFHTKRYELPEVIKLRVLNVIECKEVEQIVDANGKLSHVIYPTLDQHNEIFAILVHVCGEGYDFSLPRFVHGLLKVYSNYLSLIDDNQHDKLTQLLNRDTMEREITRILLINNERRAAMASISSFRRHTDSSTYWLCVLDIDHFKLVNDRFGHLFGDEVLILIARQMQHDIRGEEDLVYRYGGEEFVILLREQDLERAKKAFDRLRAKIERQNFPQVGAVTVSIGMVQITNQTGSGEVILQADQALFYAKEHGRNQVCCYEELIENALIQAPEQNVSGGDLEFF